MSPPREEILWRFDYGYLRARYYRHDKIQDRFSFNRILLCDTRRERRVTSVSGDNNTAVINPREVSWNGGLIMHAKCSRNSRIGPIMKLNRNVRDHFAKSFDRFQINRIDLFFFSFNFFISVLIKNRKH